MSVLGNIGNGIKAGIGTAIGGPIGSVFAAVDPTPGFSATNVAKTQYYNATGQQAPGYNATYQQAANNTVAGNGSTYTLNGIVYNAAGNPVGEVGHDSSATGAGTNTGGSGGYTGGSAPSGPTAADLAQFDLAIGQYENQLPSIDRQLAIAHGNIDSQYGQKNNELQSGYNQAQNQYGQNTVQNQQQFVSNKNQVRDTASAGLRGLLRTLGAYGGGGTDAQHATNIVAQAAARQNNGAGETFGQNQQGLDTSWGNYGIDYGNQKHQLDDWRQQQLQSADQTSLSTKQSVLQTLANLRAQRAGGNVADAQAAMAQANALQPQIDQLGAFNPTYTGQTPVYKAPDVASYTVNPNAQVTVAQNANDSLTSPWLAALLGKDKKQQTQQYAPAF